AGRVTSIDAAAALREPGVVRVLTHADMPRFGHAETPTMAQSFVPMQGDEIRYEGQPVALVLAETVEAAEAGARRVIVRVEASAARAPAEGAWAAIDGAAAPPRKSGLLFYEPDFEKGDVEAGLAAAATRVEAAYLQPPRHHNPIEPSATLASWDGDELTVFDATQYVYGVQKTLASLFDLPPERVRVVAQHTGGGFGVKGWVWPHVYLAAAAAKAVGRPVKLALTRANLYSFLGHQPRVAQRVALGADASGRLGAVAHDVVNLTSVSDDYAEFATEASKGLYATPALRTSQRVERANVVTPTAMRAPVEGPGLWALESAMDELAHALGVDPLDLRLANHADVDPATGEPWSSKKLREAYEEGARLFGWRGRPREPRRDGPWLVGQGMASCT
ncbi:MAG TPA: molybdopterin cofactor-binding domain-containing protein, partial [Polyangiaceae bacterium]|nr:molybdopterin cofactor-binding domain-containing protein [Polyangiaceae bacterium]